MNRTAPLSGCRKLATDAKCLALLVAIRAALSILGYRHMRSRLPAVYERGATSPHHARDMGRRMERLARFVPGASCLTQALALRIFLAWQGHRTTIEIGVVRETGTGILAAHAWVTCGGHVVLGNSQVDVRGFVPLAKLS